MGWLEDKSESDIPEGNPPEVTKLLGAPGTGKTTEIVGNPDIGVEGMMVENLEDYDIDEQLLVTYTKAGAAEAANRLAELTDISENEVSKRVRTIHSHAYYCMIGKFSEAEDVAGYHAKKHFCQLAGIKFEGDDSSDIMQSEDTEGDTLMAIYNWLKENRLPMEAHNLCPRSLSSHHNTLELLKKWEEFKDKNNLAGFQDMVEWSVSTARDMLERRGYKSDQDGPDGDVEIFEQARQDPDLPVGELRGKGVFVNAKVLYVDEAQDLSRLRKDWYKAQKIVADKVVLAGDEMQTIFGYSGAKPEYLLDEEGDEEILEKTYRLPSNIWNVCKSVADQCEKQKDKSIEPRTDGGSVYKAEGGSVSDVIHSVISDLEDGRSIFMLFRANYMISDFTEVLHKAGIPYLTMKEKGWETWTNKLLAKREEMSNRFNRDDGNFSQAVRQKARKMKKDGVLNYYQCQALIGSLETGQVDLDPRNLKVGTIHSAKGREADSVYLCTDTTRSIQDEMRGKTSGNERLTDAERRVYYVGMSRARSKLVFLQQATEGGIPIDLPDIIGYKESKSVPEISSVVS